MSKEIQDEIFGLTPQIRRSGVSVANSIAGALENAGDKAVHQLLNLSLRYSAELEYYLGISKDEMYKPIKVEEQSIERDAVLVDSSKMDFKGKQE
jgi:four helix bundle protein